MTMRSSVASSSSTNKTTSNKSPHCERRRGTRNNGRVLNKSNFGDSDDDVIQISDEAEPITLSRRSKEDNKEDNKEEDIKE